MRIVMKNRIASYLKRGQQWAYPTETAETVETHLARGMAALWLALDAEGST